jgi:hypothetical protein
VQDDQISVRLVGLDEDGGAVRFGDFRTFCDRMADCLRRSEAIVAETSGRVRYRIVDLQSASAGLTLAAIPPAKGLDRSKAVVGFFKQTVAQLQSGGRIDPRLTLDDLKAFREMIVRPKRTKEIWIDGGQVTSQYVANIDRMLDQSLRSVGTVTGRLERLNVHNKNEFILFPPVPGVQVVCSFTDELFPKVREAIKQNVTVTGTLFYQPDKPFPDRVHASELEIHPPDSELPKLADLKGLFQGAIGDMTAVDFVRAIRDEHPD